MHKTAGTNVAYVQGFPGAGKTYLTCLLALITVLLLDEQILWTADNNTPLDAAEGELAYLTSNSPVEHRQKFVRMPSSKHVGDGPLSVSLQDRGLKASVAKCILITASSSSMDTAKAYSSLRNTPDHTVHN